MPGPALPYLQLKCAILTAMKQQVQCLSHVPGISRILCFKLCDGMGICQMLAQLDVRGTQYALLHTTGKNIYPKYNTLLVLQGIHSPQYNSTFPIRTLSPTLTAASSSALVTPILASVTCKRAMLSSLSRLVMRTVRSTRCPVTIETPLSLVIEKSSYGS